MTEHKVIHTDHPLNQVQLNETIDDGGWEFIQTVQDIPDPRFSDPGQFVHYFKRENHVEKNPSMDNEPKTNKGLSG